jgi:glycosyltransferase involved in cell wall biosynthesis
LEKADRVVFVSRALREYVEQYGGVNMNATVVTNGYDPTVFYPPAADEERECRVVFAGSLRSVKGADRLPAIFKEVKAAVPAVKFDVVGDGACGRHLRGAPLHSA